MITKQTLIDDLKKIGIDPKGTLLCHISLKSVGKTENGADTVMDALCEYMKDGMLVIPCHTWSNVNAESPIFDVNETEPCIGVLPNLFRKREGVIRTLHPTHSLCVYGKNAAEFAKGQEKFDTPCAPGSCYGRLIEMNAQVLLIGVDFSRNTSVHCIEEIAKVPNRLAAAPQALSVRDYDGNLISTPSIRHENANSNYYVKLEEVMFKKGLLAFVRFGEAKCRFFFEKDLADICLKLLEQNIDLFGDDSPIDKSLY